MVLQTANVRDVERVISVETARMAKTEEELRSKRGKEGRVGDTLNLLMHQLHNLARIDALVETKMLRIIAELNKNEAAIKSRYEQYRRAYKQAKTRATKEQRAKYKGQIEQLGKAIRLLEGILQKIASMKKSIRSEAKRDMSTMRYIAQKAGG